MSKSIYKRHIAKTFTWRFLGTLDTFLLSWLVSGNPFTGMKIGFSEAITKMILYYLHERLWYKIKIKESKKRHLLKTVTWRIIGTIDTILIGWLISGNPFIGLTIGALEIATKMILYYFHERVWYKIDFGLEKKRRLKKWKKI